METPILHRPGISGFVTFDASGNMALGFPKAHGCTEFVKQSLKVSSYSNLTNRRPKHSLHLLISLIVFENNLLYQRFIIHLLFCLISKHYRANERYEGNETKRTALFRSEIAKS
jgi:hypothetical protein